MMQVIAIANQKGGCAKTTTAVNLAQALCYEGKRILLIDLDPQAHATFFLGISPKITISDVFDTAIENNQVNLNESLVVRNDNLYILPSSMGLSALEQSLANSTSKLELLDRIISNVSSNFDYCIIDCPPNLGILTLNALVAASYCIVPVGICQLSLKGVDSLTDILTLLSSSGRKTPKSYTF